jgi:hypothetical protein
MVNVKSIYNTSLGWNEHHSLLPFPSFVFLIDFEGKQLHSFLMGDKKYKLVFIGVFSKEKMVLMFFW